MIEEGLFRNALERQERWSESLAVGSYAFVAFFQDNLKARGKKRRIVAAEDGFVLWEGLSAYGADFDPENRAIGSKNSCF